MKFLTSNRLRKKLEEANLNICYILKRLEKPGDGATSITASPSRIFFSDEQVSSILIDTRDRSR
jgi:hypothetical protein